MNWTINQTVDLSRGYTPVVWPDALMVSGDVGAHTWRLTVLDNGVPADLSGATITGSFLRADGNTVLVSGTVSGNIAIVTLTDVCYAVEGKMKGTIKMTKSGAVITLAAVIFTVGLFTSGSVIDPGVAYADFQIDASPKGVYADLAALNAGSPTAPDVTKIYITLDDGKWCFHNGTAWVAGGVFQAAQLGPSWLNGGDGGRNLFPGPASVVYGKYISGTTGAEVTHGDFSYFTMAVSPNALYYIDAYFDTANSDTARGAYFDSNGVYIQGITANQRYAIINGGYRSIIVTPPNAATLKFVFMPSYPVSDIIVWQNVFKRVEYDQLSESLTNAALYKKDSPLIINIHPYISMHDLTGIYFRESTNSFVSSVGVSQTGMIPVVEGERYLVKNWLGSPAASYTEMSSRGNFFDENGSLISALPTTGEAASDEPIYQVPPGGKYMQITYISGATLSIEKIFSPTEDVRVRKAAIYPALSENGAVNGLLGKKWSSLGDSITFREAWQPYLVTKYGLVHTNCGIGSTYLSGSSATAFHQAVRLNAVMAPNPDIVTILGGANDLVLAGVTIGTEAEFTKTLANKDTSTFIGAYSKIIETLLEWKHTLRIVILGTTWAHMDGAEYSATLTYTDFSNASKLVAQHYGLPFVDLHGEAGFNRFTMDDSPYTDYSADHIHPNAAGGKRIAEVVDKAFSAMFQFDE